MALILRGRRLSGLSLSVIVPAMQLSGADEEKCSFLNGALIGKPGVLRNPLRRFAVLSCLLISSYGSRYRAMV
jgi:hypothetical protein